MIRKCIGRNTVTTNVHIMPNILESIDEEEAVNECEIEDVHFVVMITQNLRKTMLKK